jgi:hypothetical protein
MVKVMPAWVVAILVAFVGLASAALGCTAIERGEDARLARLCDIGLSA